jgi:hypothetical protein
MSVRWIGWLLCIVVPFSTSPAEDAQPVVSRFCRRFAAVNRRFYPNPRLTPWATFCHCCAVFVYAKAAKLDQSKQRRESAPRLRSGHASSRALSTQFSQNLVRDLKKTASKLYHAMN